MNVGLKFSNAYESFSYLLEIEGGPSIQEIQNVVSRIEVPSGSGVTVLYSGSYENI